LGGPTLGRSAGLLASRTSLASRNCWLLAAFLALVTCLGSLELFLALVRLLLGTATHGLLLA
ncbi:hypothetical protein PFISCL1PPCAC_21123, partial [Pristionchus fissidentatus]